MEDWNLQQAARHIKHATGHLIKAALHIDVENYMREEIANGTTTLPKDSTIRSQGDQQDL